MAKAISVSNDDHARITRLREASGATSNGEVLRAALDALESQGQTAARFNSLRAGQLGAALLGLAGAGRALLKRRARPERLPS